MKPINAVLRKLNFDDLQDWAGETILNRGKGYVKRVPPGPPNLSVHRADRKMLNRWPL